MASYGKKTRRATLKRKGGSKPTRAQAEAEAVRKRVPRRKGETKREYAARLARNERARERRAEKKREEERAARKAARKRKKAAAARKAARERRKKLEAAVAATEKAQAAKLRGAPGARKRLRTVKAHLQEILETEIEREQRAFRERLDEVFERRNQERAELEAKRAKKRLREAEEARLAELENARNERALVAVETMRAELATLATVAAQMLPEIHSGASLSFGEGRETRGHKRDVRINRVVTDSQAIDAILAKVAKRIRSMPGRFPLWLGTVWMTVLGDQVVGSFKIRTDMLPRDERALVESHLQSLMVDSTGVQRSREDVTRALRQMFEMLLTTRYARTMVHVHMITVWNYTKVRVAPGGTR